MHSSTQITLDFCDHSDITPLITWLSGAYADLESQAQFQVDGYWNHLKQGQQGKKGMHRGTLGLRLRSRPNGSFSVEWYRIGRRHLAGRDVSAQYIRKGRGFRYSTHALFQGQPDWLQAIAESVEERLAEIRKRSLHIGKIRLAVLQYQRAIGGYLLETESVR